MQQQQAQAQIAAPWMPQPQPHSKVQAAAASALLHNRGAAAAPKSKPSTSTSDGQPPLPPQSLRAKKKTQAERKAARQAAVTPASAASTSAASSSSSASSSAPATAASASASAAAPSSASSSSSSAARSRSPAPFLSLDSRRITSHTGSAQTLAVLPTMQAAHELMDAGLRAMYKRMQQRPDTPQHMEEQLGSVASAYALLVNQYTELNIASLGAEFQAKAPQQLVSNLSLYWAAQLSLVVERWWLHAIAVLLLDSMSGGVGTVGQQFHALYESAALMPDARRRTALLASMDPVAQVPATILHAIRMAEGLLLRFASQSAAAPSTKNGAHAKKRPSLESGSGAATAIALPLTPDEQKHLQLAAASLESLIQTPLPRLLASVRGLAILPDRMLAAVDQLTHACVPLLMRSEGPEAAALRARFEALSVSPANQMLTSTSQTGSKWQQMLRSITTAAATTEMLRSITTAAAAATEKKAETAPLTQQQLAAAGQPTGPVRRPMLWHPALPVSSSVSASASASVPAAVSAAPAAAAPFSFTSDVDDKRREEQLSALDLQRLDDFFNEPTAPLRPDPEQSEGEDDNEEAEQEESEEPSLPPVHPASSGVGLAKEVSTRYLQGLSEELERFFDARSLTPRDLADRAQALASLQTLVSALDPSLRVEVFGSAASRTAMRGSDMDCSLRSTTGKTVAPPASFWKSLVKSLRARGAYHKIIPILSARVPIVKVVDSASGIQMDLAFGQPSTPHKSALMRSYAEADPRVPALIAAVKYWAKRNNINDGSSGTLNSFGYSLMVIQYLQILRPPILPSLQQQSNDIRAAEAAAGVADHLAPATPDSRLPIATPSPPGADGGASSIPSIPLSLLSPSIRMVDPLNHSFRQRSPADQFWMRPAAETAASIIRPQDNEAFPPLGAALKSASVRAPTPPPARASARPQSPQDPFTLGALFLGFLHFYAHSFDAATMVVNVRAGGLAARSHWIGKSAAKKLQAGANPDAVASTAWKTAAEGLAIADPFDPSDNVARSISNPTWRRIRELMSQSARMMLTQGASFAQVCGDEPGSSSAAGSKSATMGFGAGGGGRGGRAGRRGFHTEAFGAQPEVMDPQPQMMMQPQPQPQQPQPRFFPSQLRMASQMAQMQSQLPPRHVIPAPGLAPPPGLAFAAAAMTHAAYAYPPHLQQQQHAVQVHQFQPTVSALPHRQLYQPPPLHSSHHPHSQPHAQPQQQGNSAAAAGQPEPRPNGNAPARANGKFLSFQQQMQQQQQ